MTNHEEITALNAEARRRGTSYGKLIASTTQPERYEIVRRAERAGEARDKRRRKKAAVP